MAGRVLSTDTSVIDFAPVGTPDILAAIANVKSLTSTDTIQVWGDNGIWDSTTGLPVCIDIFNITGTPRKCA